MKLRSLCIHHLPGIQPGFDIEAVAPGINLVVGPNASGKSSLLRAVRALLYPEAAADDAVHLEGEFDDGQGRLRIVRLGCDIRWSRAGQSVSAPPLPPYRFSTCYTLQMEDLVAVGEADSEIGARIARELAGGYDLRAVAESFRVKRVHGKAEAEALRKADKTLDEKRREYADLRREEEGLERLRQQRDVARRARREADLCRQALAALAARRQRQRCEIRLAGFPEGMAALRGDELDRLVTYRRRESALNDEYDQATQALQHARERLARSALDGKVLDESMLSEQQQRVEQLRELERRLGSLDEKQVDAEARLRIAVEGLGGEPGTAVRLDPQTLSQVEQALSGKRQCDSAVQVLETERGHLPAAPPDPPPDRFREGRRELLSWLATPGRLRWGGSWWTSVATLIVTVLVAVGAAAGIVHWAFALLWLPAAIAFYLLLRPVAVEQSRRHGAQQRYEALGLPVPASWEEPAVRKQLELLDTALQDAEERWRQWRRRGEVERELSRQKQIRQACIDELAAVAQRVGFDPERLDAGFDRWLRLSQAYDSACQELAVTRERRAGIEERASVLRGSLHQFLDSYDEAPVGPPDAGLFSGRLAALSQRLRACDKARDDARAVERDQQRIQRELAEIAAAVRELYENAGLAPDDEIGLRTRLAQREAWQKAEEDRRESASRERFQMQAIAQCEDLVRLVEANDEAALQARLQDLQAQAAQEEDLQNDIIRIEVGVKRAQQGRALEKARADRLQAEEALQQRFDEALVAEAGSFLVEKVRNEHETQSQPAVLQRAGEWFSRFTRHQFELVFRGDDGGVFLARERRSGELRALQALSSGTRMQLLLAVRLAFALEAERGCEPLPFFLDEALTTADPDRFKAVAASLRTLAAENDRQVFYLTAQPADVALWADGDDLPYMIDLAQVRRLQAAVQTPQTLALPARPELPEPGDQTPEAYAALLGVPPVHPGAAVSSVHLFYLLRDHLPLLYRLLKTGVECVGELRGLLDSGARGAVLGEHEVQLLEYRLGILEAWYAAWRQGRGRPVDPAVMAGPDSPVSKSFREDVRKLTERVNGDARALIQALEKKEVKNFRQTGCKALRAWLVERGYLDEREPLDDQALRLAALSAAGEGDRAGSDPGDTVNLLLASLESGIRAAAETAERVEMAEV